MSEAFDSYKTSYDSVVQRSIDFSGLPHEFFLRAKADQLRLLFDMHFGPDARPSLLDIGCGVGKLHSYLQPFVGVLAGCDVSTESLDRARNDNPGIEYRTSSIKGLPWKSGSFDVALAVCVLHHVPMAERALFAAEMARTIRQGGLAVLIEHNPLNPLTRLAVLRCPFDADAILLGARRARGLLRLAGMKRVRSWHFLALPPRLAFPGAERRLSRFPLGAQYVAAGEQGRSHD